MLSTSQPLFGCFAVMGCHISQFSCNLLHLCCCDVLRYISPIPKPQPPLVCGFCQCLSNSAQKPLYCLTTLSRWAKFQFKQRLLSSPPNKQSVGARTRSGFIMPCSEMSFHGKMASLLVHSRNSLVSTNLWCYHNSCGVLEITAVGRRRSVRGKGAAAVEECGMSTLRPTGISAYIKVTSSGP